MNPTDTNMKLAYYFLGETIKDSLVSMNSDVVDAFYRDLSIAREVCHTKEGWISFDTIDTRRHNCSEFVCINFTRQDHDSYFKETTGQWFSDCLLSVDYKKPEQQSIGLHLQPWDNFHSLIMYADARNSKYHARNAIVSDFIDTFYELINLSRV